MSRHVYVDIHISYVISITAAIGSMEAIECRHDLIDLIISFINSLDVFRRKFIVLRDVDPSIRIAIKRDVILKSIKLWMHIQFCN